VLYLFDPADGGYPVCPFHALTGLHCPGCGTLRAMHELLHGRIAAALAMNPLSTCAIPIMIGAPIWSIASRRWRPSARRAGRRWTVHPAWLLVTAIIAFGILRNVPVYPFTLLAPHYVESDAQSGGDGTRSVPATLDGTRSVPATLSRPQAP
ncbi:MAG TPA: DUF2752 domain-containing protein, partial [Pirellulales bacterium]